MTLGKPLEIQPGRVYVIECDEHLTAQRAADLRDRFFLATQAKCVVLAPGMRIARVRRWWQRGR